MTSSQPRRDQTTTPIYGSAAAPTSTTTMYAPIAERAIPYEQYMSRDGEHIYSTSRVTPRSAPAAAGRSAATKDDAVADDDEEELRQFSREPTNMSISSTVDGVTASAAAASAVGSRPSTADKLRSIGDDGAGITAGFDSNTLKRMLQTLPELSTPVDLTHEFEREFADVVGGPAGGVADGRREVATVPSPPPPVDDDLPVPASGSLTAGGGMTSVSPAVTSSHVMNHTDTGASAAEVLTSDVIMTERENGSAELVTREPTVTTVAFSDVLHPSALVVTSSPGKCRVNSNLKTVKLLTYLLKCGKIDD